MRRYCGRNFSDPELQLIKQLISADGSRSRADLSRRVCRALGWYKADGGLKQMSCRVAMLRMQADGLFQLPPPRRKRPQSKIHLTHRTDPPPASRQALLAQPSLRLELVQGPTSSGLWNEYIQRYHYLGYKSLPGAQARYFINAAPNPLALLAFGASAWQCAPRDEFIGWSHQQRQRNLHLIVNNARFLILPWVKSKNLASRILSLAAKQLPKDWQNRYHYQPVLLESFVEKARFLGTCYKAANWIYVGQTKGRGKLGPAGKQSVPIKDLWLLPLKPNFRRALTL